MKMKMLQQAAACILRHHLHMDQSGSISATIYTWTNQGKRYLFCGQQLKRVTDWPLSENDQGQCLILPAYTRSRSHTGEGKSE